MTIHTDGYGSKEEIYCQGSFEPNLRNIDPTIKIISKTNKNNIVSNPIHKKIYKFPELENLKWLSNFDDFPDINNMLHLNYDKQNFILLNGGYSWSENKIQNLNPNKRLWIQINGYIVKKEQIDNIVDELSKMNFMGKWMPEPHKDYQLYNKEYYWSNAFKFFNNSYYCMEEWVYIDRIDNTFGKVLLPTSKYVTEHQGDLFDDSSYSCYKPCYSLFNSLNMKYGNENSILYDNCGKVICFDSYELLNEDIGFFINTDKLINYLEDNKYDIFWTILAGKELDISYEYLNKKRNYKSLNCSGIYRFKDKNIFGKMNVY